LIFNFLAILDMLALQVLTIQVGEGFNNFWISKYSNAQIADVSETNTVL
jgi:segregation and condensation protein A